MSIKNELEVLFTMLREEVPDLSCTTFDGDIEIFDRLSETSEMADKLLESENKDDLFIVFNKDHDDIFVSFSINEEILRVIDRN